LPDFTTVKSGRIPFGDLLYEIRNTFHTTRSHIPTGKL
jgi:hypothetical protein